MYCFFIYYTYICKHNKILKAYNHELSDKT